MQSRSARPFFAALVLAVLFVGGCDSGPTPTETQADRSVVGADAPRVVPASGGLVPPELPPGAADLPIEERLRTVLVDFPGPEQVGICHTQVATAKRPIPFRVHRLEVEIPDAAWDEAEGRTALLQYRRFEGTDRHLTRVARCRVPASMIAIDHLVDRFSIGTRSGPDLDLSMMPEQWSPADGSSPSIEAWDIPLASSGSDDGCTDYNDPEEPEEPCEVDEVDVDGSECTNPKHDRNEDGVCECANGSDEPDCFLDEDDPTDPDDDPDCDFEPCGGSGGDADGYPEEECRPYLNPDCEHRYIGEWKQSELIILQETVTRLDDNGCHDISATLMQYAEDEMLGLWDVRIYAGGDPSQVRYGRVANSEPNEIYYGYILAWSGEGQLDGDSWNLHRTLAHEASHVVNPGWSHSQIDGYIASCLGDLYSPVG